MAEREVISPSLLRNLDYNAWVDQDLFNLGPVANQFLDDEYEVFATASQLTDTGELRISGENEGPADEIPVANGEYDELFAAACCLLNSGEIGLPSENEDPAAGEIPTEKDSELFVAALQAEGTAGEVSGASTSEFGEPVDDAYLESLQSSAVPEKTRKQTKWVLGRWNAWAKSRAERTKETVPSLSEMTVSEIASVSAVPDEHFIIL